MKIQLKYAVLPWRVKRINSRVIFRQGGTESDDRSIVSVVLIDFYSLVVIASIIIFITAYVRILDRCATAQYRDVNGIIKN